MKTKKLILIALFIALSFLGAMIKIPSPVGTLGLDSLPGFLAGLLIGGIEGGIIALIGHLIIAFYNGFFLTMPVHIIIAIMMFIAVYCYSLAYKRSQYFAVFVGIIVNGVLAPLALLILPGIGLPFFIATTPFVLAASTLNVVLSYLLYVPLSKYIKLD